MQLKFLKRFVRKDSIFYGKVTTFESQRLKFFEELNPAFAFIFVRSSQRISAPSGLGILLIYINRIIQHIPVCLVEFFLRGKNVLKKR